MKKIPCVFKRDFSNPRNPKILNEVTPGCEWVLAGEGIATVKYDGTSCLVKGGQLYKRYDAKRGKAPPNGFTPAQEPDPVTGHWPGWVPVDVDNPDPADVWHALAWAKCEGVLSGTYELLGPRINSNHEGVDHYSFTRHGSIECAGAPRPRTFDSLREFLSNYNHEGIVFWREPFNVDGDLAKLTRENFGFSWPEL